MTLRIVVDMNLSVEWIPLLEGAGWTAIHWSAVGDPRANDATIMAWASTNNYAVFTHDLDFGAALAMTHASKPSVVQVRAQQVLP
jgi:predicted nuclease of predicted toxin-antitoxin system